MDTEKRKRSPRETVQFVLESEMPIDLCEYLHLAEHTTFQTALIMGGLERALRGDSAAWRAFMEYADPLDTVIDDDYIDELSKSLFEEFAKRYDEDDSWCQDL